MEPPSPDQIFETLTAYHNSAALNAATHPSPRKLHMVRRGALAALFFLACLLQGTTRAPAGTTGSLRGSVKDATTGQPIARIRVTVTSPAQTATATTDAAGRYAIGSLAPDTYTVSVPETATRLAASVSGVTIDADSNVVVDVPVTPKLKQIGAFER